MEPRSIRSRCSPSASAASGQRSRGRRKLHDLAATHVRTDLGERSGDDLHLLEIARRGLAHFASSACEKDVLGRDSVIAVDDIAPERDPVLRGVAGLFFKLAFGAGERLLALLDVARGNGERHRSRAVFVRAHEDHLVALDNRDHRDEIPSPYPEEAVDLAPVGQLDLFLADLHPGRTPQERAARERAAGSHQGSLNRSSRLRSGAKPSQSGFRPAGVALTGRGKGPVRIQARFPPQGATGSPSCPTMAANWWL